MDGREWEKIQTTSTPQKTNLKKMVKPMVTKRLKQLEKCNENTRKPKDRVYPRF